MEENKNEFEIKRLHISVPASLFYELKTSGKLRDIDNIVIDLLTDYLRGEQK